MMNNKILLTVIVVLVLAFGVGALLFAFNDQGVSAEIVDVQVNPDAPRQATLTLCAPAGQGLGPGASAQVQVLVGETTELLDQRKRSPANIRPADLAAGQRVRLWIDDARSEPQQLRATRISVLADPVAGQSICAR